MVEGGASIISSFLESGLVDLVIITIAPVLIGNGVRVIRSGVRASAYETLSAEEYLTNVSLRFRWCLPL